MVLPMRRPQVNVEATSTGRAGDLRLIFSLHPLPRVRPWAVRRDARQRRGEHREGRGGFWRKGNRSLTLYSAVFCR